MIWLLAIGFAIVTNHHFGWNGMPKSDAELICDGIALVLVALAILKSK